MLDALAIGVGLIVLVVGGELVVRGASRLALGFGLSPMLVGLTVVAFGTSSPELAVSLGATVGGSPDVAVGNVVGSNIYNILLVLGVAALLRPLVVQQQIVRFDVPVVIGVSVLLWLLVLDGRLGALEGALLVLLLAVYLAISVRIGRRQAAAEPTSEGSALGSPIVEQGSTVAAVVLFLVGLGALVLGAQLLVAGATSVAAAFGVPELVIGLTVVAIGTSLPELVTSAIAALRGHRDLAVGNVMGSNLFNILGILGLSALVSGGGIPVAAQVRDFDIPVMTVVAFACLPLLFTGYVVRRWEGALFAGYAVLYTAYVVLTSVSHPAVEVLELVLLVFVLPLTAIVVGAVTLRALHGSRPRRWPTGGRDP